MMSNEELLEEVVKMIKIKKEVGLMERMNELSMEMDEMLEDMEKDLDRINLEIGWLKKGMGIFDVEIEKLRSRMKD